MKQLEQEKDMLLQGLEVAERLRDWYHKQIATVTEKQNYVEKTSCSVCHLLHFMWCSTDIQFKVQLIGTLLNVCSAF